MIPDDDTGIDPVEHVPTGTPGLDAVLRGGFLRNGMHLVSGQSGTGKSTLGLQFLLAGAQAGASVLYLTLSQHEDTLRRIAGSHGWSLDGVEVRGMHLHDVERGIGADQTVLHAHEVELPETMQGFRDAVDRLKPARAVFDSLSELRLLAGDRLRYRREVLRLRSFLAARACTALLLLPSDPGAQVDPIQDLVDSVLQLEQSSPTHGGARRRMRPLKARGSALETGYHDVRIRTGGLIVFPRLQTGGASQQRPRTEPPSLLGNSVPGLDGLLGGGLEAGSSCLVIGPTGVGKTSLASGYALAAAENGERAGVFLFEERPETFLKRSANLGMDLQRHVRGGRVTLELVDTGELSPGEFAHRVLREVDEAGARVVVIDSVTGYAHAMPDETLAVSQLHELLVTLSERDVLTLLVVAQHGIIGTDLHGPDVSYVAGSMVLLRHFEAAGGLRKSLLVVKRRAGETQPAIREIRFGSEGIHLGAPLTRFSGVITGTPRFHGDIEHLFDVDDDAAPD